MASPVAILTAAALLAVPLAADAQRKGAEERYTYRCTGKDGKKYYGHTIPTQCLGQPIDQLNSRGLLVKRIDPEADEKARLEKEAEEKRLAEEAQERREESRRNRALLATYTSEKDIELARKRALADNTLAVQEAQRRIDVLNRRRAGYDKELGFYKDGAKPPAKLLEDIRTTQLDIEAMQGLIANKEREAISINERYDEDRRRYRELAGMPK